MELWKAVACLGTLLNVVVIVLSAEDNTEAVDVYICKLASCESQTLPAGSYIQKYCEENKFEISGRCCCTAGNHTTIVGLDLSNCNLTTLDVLQQDLSSESGVWDRSELVVLALEDNAVNDSNTEFFTGMVNLDYLSLPSDCQCPGGHNAWNSITTEKTSTVCQQQLDICQMDNVTCPDNSHCVMHSPGVDWCICDDTYHGYKCMREGTFPAIPFGVGLSVTTVVLAIVGHVTLRRNAQPIR